MSVPVKRPRPVNYALWAVTSLFLCLALCLPGTSRSQVLVSEGFDDFDTGTRPAGWTFFGCNANSDTYTTAGDYGLFSPSIKLDADGDYITTESFLDPVELSFWVKGQGTAGTSSLLVEEYYAPAWGTVTDILPLPGTGTVYSGLALNPSASQLRFTFNQSVGDLAFDDVLVTGAAPTATPVPTATVTPTPEEYKTPPPTPPTPTPISACEGFNNFQFGVRPDGWLFDGIGDSDTFTTAGDFGVASPSLRMNADDDEVITGTLEWPESLTFWAKGQAGVGSSTLLVAEYYYFAGWTAVTMVEITPSAGDVIGPIHLNINTSEVKFLFEYSGIVLAFDDVCITFSDPPPTPSPTPTVTPTPVGYHTPVCVCEGFDNFVEPGWQVPPGWEFMGITDNYTTPGDYGVASPALKLDSDGDGFITGPLSRADSLTFWVRGQGTEISSALSVQEYYFGGGWSEITAITNFPTDEGAVLGPFPVQFVTSELMFLYSLNAGEFALALDDVCICLVDPTPIPTASPTPTARPTRTPVPTPSPNPGPITGRVYDRVTGAGIANLYVVALPVNAPRADGDLTDSNGNYRIEGFGGTLDAGIYKVFCSAAESSGVRRYRDQYYDQKEKLAPADLVASNSSGIDFPLYRVDVYATPIPSPTPSFSMIRVAGGDYNGDGISDLAVFRPSTGLWAVRGITRAYFGRAGDVPVSADYSGDSFADLAVFRAAYGLWAVRGVTRSYFGRNGDIPVPGDYDADGLDDVAVFRPSSGLWAVAGLGRSYFGRSGDIPVSGDYTGDGFVDIAVFRPSSGLWAVKDVTRVYFGRLGDAPVPGNYDGLGMVGPAIYRGSSGLWAVRWVTRAYFGNAAFQAVPANYAVPGSDRIGVFGPGTGLWSIQGLTRAYFGRSEDLPATR